jgi:hypothetical protein
LFDRVFALETAHEVWMQLKKIHVGNKKDSWGKIWVA